MNAKKHQLKLSRFRLKPLLPQFCAPHLLRIVEIDEQQNLPFNTNRSQHHQSLLTPTPWGQETVNKWPSAKHPNQP